MSEPPTTPPTGPPPSWSAAPPAPPVEQWRGTPYDHRTPGTNGFAIASLVLGMIVPAVPCDAPHHGEVFARFDLADGDYPAEAELDELAGDGCFDRLADYAPAAVDDPAVDVFYSFPQARGWRQGDHEVTCFAVSTEGRLPAGSIADRTAAPVDA